jgi:hypothetical protein
MLCDDYFIILDISIYCLVWLQLDSKAKIYVISKALNICSEIWPSLCGGGGWVIGFSHKQGFQINIFNWSRLFPYNPNIVFCYVSQAT